MLAMNFLKRALPFILTLSIGMTVAHLVGSLFPRPTYVCMTEEFASYQVASTSSIIVSQPSLRYTAAARKNQTEGVVQLRVVLNADRKVADVRPLSMLPYGLTEEAMQAAMRVEFIPATVEGVPVASERLLEYYFSVR
jgi:TonB family protein